MLVVQNALVVVQNNGKDMYNCDAGANLFAFLSLLIGNYDFAAVLIAVAV